MNNLQNPQFLDSRCKNESRLMNAVAGDVSYTGYGFKPRALYVFGLYVGSSTLRCFGSASVSDMTGKCIHTDYLSNANQSNAMFKFQTGIDEFQFAVVKSFDNDGFTLTWTKGVGGLAVSAYLNVVALR